jgi:aldehyde:ferredoxin oxidoreductase
MAPEVPDRLLRVDLSAGVVESEAIPEPWRRKYVGGKGLGARYLYEELDPGTDPLAPENRLLFLLGPLSGLLPGEGRYAAVTKSPLTGTFLDSYSGGRFPGALRGSLGDHLGLLVEGRAEEPVRLVVSGGDARIEPAETWGEDAAATCEAYDGVVACIGPAGENRVSYATIASDRTEHHAGRGGAGAVMGSKRLKAVVAADDPPETPAALAALRERDTEAFRESDTGRWLTASGTLETVDFADEAGVLAARGWQERGFDGADGIGIEAARDAASGRETDGELPGDFRVDTPAGETVPRGATAMTLGAGLGLEAFDAVAELGERCNRLGVDLISAGNAVAWAIRAAEAGAIDRDIEFDDPEGARDLLREIATRSTPLGDALGDGVAAAAERLGGAEFVPTVKEMALPAYDPRGAASMALAYATSDRGACHRRARPVEREVFEDWGPQETAAAVIEAQDARSIRWSLIADDFAGEALADHGAEWLDAIGHPHDGDLRVTGERIWNLVRLVNVREGFDRSDDGLPAGLELGPEDALDPETFETTLECYYAARGWGTDGRPSRERLAALDLLGTVDEHTSIAEEPTSAIRRQRNTEPAPEDP